MFIKKKLKFFFNHINISVLIVMTKGKEDFKTIIASIKEQVDDTIGKELDKLTKLYNKHQTAKDPNRPKRPLTPFFVFLNENREKVKSKNSELKSTEIAKKLGEMWRALTESQKQEYKNKADELATKNASKEVVDEEVDEEKPKKSGKGKAKK